MDDEQPAAYTDARSNYGNPYQYQFQPVTMVNSVASLALSVIATILAIALLRSHARNRRLHEQLAGQESEHG